MAREVFDRPRTEVEAAYDSINSLYWLLLRLNLRKASIVYLKPHNNKVWFIQNRFNAGDYMAHGEDGSKAVAEIDAKLDKEVFQLVADRTGVVLHEGTDTECDMVKQAFIKYGISPDRVFVVPKDYYEASIEFVDVEDSEEVLGFLVGRR